MTWLPQNDGRTMAELQAGMNYSPSQPHVYPQENQWGQVIRAIAQAAPEVFNYIRQQQSDKIANQLLAEQGYQGSTGGAAELKLRMEMANAKAQQEYRLAEAERQRALANNVGGNGGGMTPFQSAHMDLMRQREARLASQPPRNRLGMSSDELMAAIQNGGVHRYQDDKGSHVTITPQGGMPIEVKENDLNKELNRVTPQMRGQTAEGNEIGNSGQSPQSKPLDKATASAILQEAGGDKNKAREIARQRGYSF